LGELQENARLTFNELGRRVNLSAPAVAERVRRMEEAGIIIGYRAEVDPAKVGFPLGAFLRVEAPGVNHSRIGALAEETPEVVECHHITGAESFLMRVVLSGTDHLQGMLHKLAPWGSPTTSIVLSSPVPRRGIERAPDRSGGDPG
jgi:Lrp/AsnC family leucine-responsive transcriptional regulator